MRRLWPVGLAIVSAIATLALVKPYTKVVEVENASAASTLLGDTGGQAAASDSAKPAIVVPRVQSAGPPAPRLFERQRMALEDPERGLYTWNEGIERALNEAARAQAKHEDVGPFQCFGGLELVGRQVLEFALDVQSTDTHLEVWGLRYVRQLDGTPIPEDAGKCWAEFFEGRHAVDAAADGPAFIPMNRTVEYVLDFTLEEP